MTAGRMPEIVSARGDRLRDATGQEYLDLNMGYGSVWLGHGHPAVVEAVRQQLDAYAAPGFLPHPALGRAEAALAPYLPSTHVLGGLYSTGMEAMETALRAARAHTGRHELAGFAGSTHGRSALTSALGADDAAMPLPFVHRLPPLSTPAAGLESALRSLLERRTLAAIVVEPVQMTGGGHALDAAFGSTLVRLAREHGTAVVFDETLTGLHRCGTPLWCSRLDAPPDLVVLGKGLANGFPASAVVRARDFAWDRARVKPGSTYFNHPLACAAVAATLSELSAVDADRRVADIASVVRGTLDLVGLRGEGALWCLAVPDAARLNDFVARLQAERIVVSYYAGHVRLTPAITIAPDVLRDACRAIRRAHAAAFG